MLTWLKVCPCDLWMLIAHAILIGNCLKDPTIFLTIFFTVTVSPFSPFSLRSSISCLSISRSYLYSDCFPDTQSHSEDSYHILYHSKCQEILHLSVGKLLLTLRNETPFLSIPGSAVTAPVRIAIISASLPALSVIKSSLLYT